MSTEQSIRVGNGATVHHGDEFGASCGAGFNRRGANSKVTKVDSPITCTKKACAKHAS